MRIFGIDPSLTSTGICVVDCEFEEANREMLSEILLKEENDFPPTVMNSFFEIVHLSEIKPPKEYDKELKKIRKEIRNGENTFENLLAVNSLLYSRMNCQADFISHLLNQHEPEIVVMEDYSFHSSGRLTQMAEMKGYLYSSLSNSQYLKSLLVLPITTIKKVASTKGNANKTVIYEGIQRFPIDIELNPKNDDEIDALAICLTMYYGIFNQLFSLDYPKSSLRKEKNYYNKWKTSFKNLNTHIGTGWYEYLFAR